MEMEHFQQEILRYLGYGQNQADETVLTLIDSCAKELEQAAAPKHLSREYPLTLLSDHTINGGCFTVKSQNLSRNLKDCHQIIVFAATLGAGADHLIRKYSRLQMSRAVIMQAAAAAMIEDYCDTTCRQMKQAYEAQGLYLRPRFSPGYGDFPLSCQPALLDGLDAGKRIGIRLTDSLLMTPSKSVTAVIGVSRRPCRCQVAGCETCEKVDCLYRRDSPDTGSTI